MSGVFKIRGFRVKGGRFSGGSELTVKVEGLQMQRVRVKGDLTVDTLGFDVN